MPIIHARRVENPLPRLEHAYQPMDMDAIRQGFIDGCGLERYKAGEQCDYHYHDSEEYWFILDGTARVRVGDEEEEVEHGAIVFTPMGQWHQFTAVTDVSVLWLHAPLQGKKRAGHLHEED